MFFHNAAVNGYRGRSTKWRRKARRNNAICISLEFIAKKDEKHEQILISTAHTQRQKLDAVGMHILPRPTATTRWEHDECESNRLPSNVSPKWLFEYIRCIKCCTLQIFLASCRCCLHSCGGSCSTFTTSIIHPSVRMLLHGVWLSHSAMLLWWFACAYAHHAKTHDGKWIKWEPHLHCRWDQTYWLNWFYKEDIYYDSCSRYKHTAHLLTTTISGVSGHPPPRTKSNAYFCECTTHIANMLRGFFLWFPHPSDELSCNEKVSHSKRVSIANPHWNIFSLLYLRVAGAFGLRSTCVRSALLMQNVRNGFRSPLSQSDKQR